jgi:CDP-diacylglycerol--glycerol-3-phosphate 3-phosphatidyltransferase
MGSDLQAFLRPINIPSGFEDDFHRNAHQDGHRVNIPNSLTIVRIFFVPLLVAVLVQERNFLSWQGGAISNDILALFIFWVAAATDLLDGYLARRWKQVTTIGTLLDPIADKMLVSAALIALVQVRVVPGWMVVVIVGREFAVSGLRSIAAAEGYTISASELGKTKTVSQVLAVSLLLIGIHRPEIARWATYSLYLVVVFSLWSAFEYFGRFWRGIDVRIKQRRRAELLIADRQRRRVLIAEKRAALAERTKAKMERIRTGDFGNRAQQKEVGVLPPST